MTPRCGAVNTLEGWDAIQRDLDKLKKWASMNIMKFNKAKSKVLHMGRVNPRYQYRMGIKGLKGALPRRTLGVLVGEKLDRT